MPSTIVEAPIEQAFYVFTDGIGTWWSPDHHIIEAELAEMVFEPRVGRHVYDVGVDGSECPLGARPRLRPARPASSSAGTSRPALAARERPRTSAARWRCGSPRWARTTTRVDLEHRHLERHGEGWEAMAAGVGSPGGWPAGVEAFAQRLAS